MYLNIEDIKPMEMLDGFTAQFVHTKEMTISYWDVKKGSELPEHSHYHEQISQVIEGEFRFTIDKETKVMTPGQIAVIPSNAVHSGLAVTDCKIMDIFVPVREDYKELTK